MALSRNLYSYSLHCSCFPSLEEFEAFTNPIVSSVQLRKRQLAISETRLKRLDNGFSTVVVSGPGGKVGDTSLRVLDPAPFAGPLFHQVIQLHVMEMDSLFLFHNKLRKLRKDEGTRKKHARETSPTRN